MPLTFGRNGIRIVLEKYYKSDGKGGVMNREGLNTEYKREYIEDIKKTIIAFANTDGGTLWIGVEDDGTVVGVPDADSVMLKVTSSIRDAIKPDVTLFTICERVELEGKEVVAVKVQKGTACPYYLSGKGIRPEGVFIRLGASTVQATKTWILRMIKESSGETYEEVRSPYQELTFTSMKTEFDTADIKLEKAQMKSLHIIGEDGLYTNLGFLLSDQCTHTIRLALFEGNTKEIFKDRYEFSGSLFQQIRECYATIDRYNRTGSRFEGLMRIDSRDYPTSALREALLNAVIHRDYSFSASILISIYDNRIEFVAIGGLVPGIGKEDIYLGISMLRNKNLASIFYRLKLIEAFGTGIPKIMESYEEYQGYMIKPKIEITENAFKLTLFNTTEVKNQDCLIKESKGEELYFTDGEQRILDMFVSAYLIRRLDIEKELSVSQPMAVKYLKNLLDKGAIVKIGSGKNVRYRLK